MTLPKTEHCKNFLTYRSNIFIFLFFFFRSNVSIFPMMTIKPRLACCYKWVTRKACNFVFPVYFVVAFEDYFFSYFSSSGLSEKKHNHKVLKFELLFLL